MRPGDGIGNNRPWQDGNDFINGDRNNLVNNINNNHWQNNHQNIINNSPSIINGGYRPGAAWPGNGYGYQGDWGYGGGGYFNDDSWCYGAGWRPAYYGYHSDWYNGVCQCDSWSDWGATALGAAGGWMTGWMLGSRPYDWGYSSYENPYYEPEPIVQSVVVDQTTPVYDYSQPLNTEVPPPAAAVADPAIQSFDAARAEFQAGNYQGALQLTDVALAKMPNDAAIHEFRALVLFALGGYNEAASALYTVLSVGPGWDWSTMTGLYGDLSVYEQQLRTLEQYRTEHTTEAPPAFVLAYHYLTAGYTEEAADQFAAVVQLQPADKLSASLLASLRPAAANQQPPAETPPTPAPPLDASALVGNWQASNQGTAISLALQPDGKFTWDVSFKGKERRLAGKYTLEDGRLTLAQTDGGALVGTFAQQDKEQFTFRALGAPANDPGLQFAKM